MVYGFVDGDFSFFCELKKTQCEWFFTSSLSSKSVEGFTLLSVRSFLSIVELETVSLLHMLQDWFKGFIGLV